MFFANNFCNYGNPFKRRARSFFCLWTLDELDKLSFSLVLPLEVMLHASLWEASRGIPLPCILLSMTRTSFFLFLNGILSASKRSDIEGDGCNSRSLIWGPRISFSFLTRVGPFICILHECPHWGHEIIFPYMASEMATIITFLMIALVAACFMRSATTLLLRTSPTTNQMVNDTVNWTIPCCISMAHIFMASTTVFSAILEIWESLLHSDSMNALSIIFFSSDNRTQQSPPLLPTFG